MNINLHKINYYKVLNRISFVETANLPLQTLDFLSLLSTFLFSRKENRNGNKRNNQD